MRATYQQSLSFYRFCIAPLDVIKIRLQLQSRTLLNSVSPNPRGALHISSKILREEGVRVSSPTKAFTPSLLHLLTDLMSRASGEATFPPSSCILLMAPSNSPHTILFPGYYVHYPYHPPSNPLCLVPCPARLQRR